MGGLRGCRSGPCGLRVSVASRLTPVLLTEERHLTSQCRYLFIDETERTTLEGGLVRVEKTLRATWGRGSRAQVLGTSRECRWDVETPGW